MDKLESRKVATRYARALFEAAAEQNDSDAVAQSMQSLISIYAQLPELQAFFENPGLPAAEKSDILNRQFKRGVSPLVASLLDLLMTNERIALLPDIAQVYTELQREHQGIAEAEVIVPVAMDDYLEGRMRSTLEKLFGYRQVELKTTVDPSMIAGAIVKIGDKIIDGSYRGKLDLLTKQIG